MGSRTSVTSKMELFVTIFDNFHFLKIVTKTSILDATGILDPTLIAEIFFLCGHFASGKMSWAKKRR